MEIFEFLFLGVAQLGLLHLGFPGTFPFLLPPVLGIVSGMLPAPKWQLYPAYLVMGILIGASFLEVIFLPPVADAALSTPSVSSLDPPNQLPSGSSSAFADFILIALKWSLLVIAQAGLLVSCVSLYLLPVPKLLPLPKDAPFQVGTFHMHLEDESRPEWSGKHDSGKRQVMIQVFYPTRGEPMVVEAAPNGDRVQTKPHPSTYFRWLESFGPGLAKKGRLPDFVLNHMRHIKVHALRHAACVDPATVQQQEQQRRLGKGWPVLFFSHGFSGYGSQNYQLMEQLACQGYVIVAVTHSYDSCATVLSNGDIRNFEADVPLSLPAEEIYRIRRDHLETRTLDVLFVLDSLEQIQKGGTPKTSQLCLTPNTHYKTLAGKLDLEAINGGVGVMGHSFGGATSILCARDQRVGAVVGFDAWHFPLPKEILNDGCGVNPKLHFCLLEAPKFFEEDHEISRDNRAQAQQLLKTTKASSSEKKSYHILVKGTKHHAFCDLPILAHPLLFRLVGLNFGTLPNRDLQKVMSETCLALFGQCQRGGSPDMLSDACAQLSPCVLTEIG